MNDTKSIYEVVKEGYSSYQTYVNNGKFIPGLDGLKLVQRRYLLAVRHTAKSKFSKSSEVLGVAMSKWHPHEVQDDVLYALVRQGFVLGQGNFGLTSTYRNSESAAIRYTEVKYNTAIDDVLFRFEDYFNMIDGETGSKEPEFLITPIPIALLRGLLGIGVGGVRSKIPAFTYESILKAYAENDPNQLKSAYGLEIDYEASTLDKLWNVGHGKLVLKFNYQKNNDGSVDLFGDSTVAKPLLGKLIKWEKERLINIKDMSTDKMRLRFSRVKGIRKISDKDIFDEIRRVSVIDDRRSTYIIMLSHKGKVLKMGIKSWLDQTMKLYNLTFNKWKSMEIDKNLSKIDRYTMIPVVAKHIMDQKTTSEIAKIVGRSEGFVRSIESLSLKMLRKTDYDNQIKRVEKENEKISKADVKDFISQGIRVDSLMMSI